jgi:hypothetical protein
MFTGTDMKPAGRTQQQTSKRRSRMAASRKLYRELAATIKHRYENPMTDSPLDVIECLAREIASDLKQDNMAFDRSRFLAACGVSE